MEPTPTVPIPLPVEKPSLVGIVFIEKLQKLFALRQLVLDTPNHDDVCPLAAPQEGAQQLPVVDPTRCLRCSLIAGVQKLQSTLGD